MPKSKQDYETPDEFFEKVCERWPISFDLACSSTNFKCQAHFDHAEVNSLEMEWNQMMIEKYYLWLNPPFAGTGTWMKKCLEEMRNGCRIVTLTLADTGTRWFKDYVYGNAQVFVITGRLKFKGCEEPHIKEVMLCVWDSGLNGNGFLDMKEFMK